MSDSKYFNKIEEKMHRDLVDKYGFSNLEARDFIIKYGETIKMVMLEGYHFSIKSFISIEKKEKINNNGDLNAKPS